MNDGVYMINGCPHVECSCPANEGKCPLGIERVELITRLSRCVIPADPSEIVVVHAPHRIVTTAGANA